MKTVLVFGTFDGVHEGHRAFLREARSLGDHLIAVVAQDAVVEMIKGRRPKWNILERIEHIQKEDGVNEVVMGDGDLGEWRVLEKYKPNVIALGYDQTVLKTELERHFAGRSDAPALRVMRSFEPQKYKSSLLNGLSADLTQ